MDKRLPWISDAYERRRPIRCGSPVLQFGLGVAALLAAMVGCGGPTYVPVSGIVTLDGSPVANAGVMFVPIEEGPTAAGTTDSNGRYHLKTINRTGVIAGRYRVVVSKQEVTPADNPSGSLIPMDVRVKWIVPEKFSKVETSGLTADVASDHTDFQFDLSSQK